MLRLNVILVICTLLTGCSDFPDLDYVVSDQAHEARYPALTPFDGVFTRTDLAEERDAMAESKSLATRAKILRKRAKQLRRPVLTPSEERELKAATKRNHG